MFEYLNGYAADNPVALERIKELRVSVTFRAIHTEGTHYDLRGPAILNLGRFGGRDMLRRWSLNAESRWYTVVVDGLGNAVEWQLWKGSGEWENIPLELAIDSTRALTELACRHHLRMVLDDQVKTVSRELEYIAVDSEGRAINVG